MIRESVSSWLDLKAGTSVSCTDCPSEINLKTLPCTTSITFLFLTCETSSSLLQTRIIRLNSCVLLSSFRRNAWLFTDTSIYMSVENNTSLRGSCCNSFSEISWKVSGRSYKACNRAFPSSMKKVLPSWWGDSAGSTSDVRYATIVDLSFLANKPSGVPRNDRVMETVTSFC